MTPLAVWARRSLALWTAPFFLGALVFGAWSRDGWQYEWLWGMRAAVGITVLITPVLAGSVAFDIIRAWGPLAKQLGPSTLRWRGATLALVGAHVGWAFVCVVAVWVAAAVRLGVNHALWQWDPTLPFEVLAAFCAAAGVGLLLGMRFQTLAAAPLAAIIVFACQALTAPYGLVALFSPMTLVDSAVGLQRDVGAASLAIALNLAVALWCGVVALDEAQGNSRRTWRRSLALGAATGLVLLPGAAHAVIKPLEYRPSTDREECVDQGGVRVCGPEGVGSLLRDLAGDLDSARVVLAGSGLPLPREFVLGIPGEDPSTGVGPTYAFVAPADVTEARRTGTMARVLSSPRVCPQVIDPDPDTWALLDRQEQVRKWIVTSLETGGGSAPPAIQSAYRELVECRLAS